MEKTREEYENELKEMLKPVYAKQTNNPGNIKPAYYNIVKVMNWYMETVVGEPVLAPDVSLSNSFNIEDKGYDLSTIWWSLALLPLLRKGRPEKENTCYYLWKLYAITQDAIPNEIRGLWSYNYTRNFDYGACPEQVMDKIQEFNEWCETCRTKLEIFFTRYYWLNGAKKCEFLLTKLYRDQFADTDITHNKDAEVLEQANNIRIELVEAKKHAGTEH